MKKGTAESYVEILERFCPLGWRIVHVCPGSEYTIGNASAICSSSYIVSTVLYYLHNDPCVLQGADPREVSYLMGKLEKLIMAGDRKYKILI